MSAFRDDDLMRLAAGEVAPLPQPRQAGWAPNGQARIHYALAGAGPPVLLLHSGLGHGGDWARTAPALIAAGFTLVLVDSRGHGRSTRDHHPLSYEVMAADAAAVMDHLGLARAAVVGWSDGAATGLALAKDRPERVAGVFFFACNVDPTGTKPFVMTPVIERMLARNRRDFAALSATPDGFDDLFAALGPMQQSQPNYSAATLSRIAAPVTVAIGEGDEFITLDHMQWMARSLPNARLRLLPGVSHFAPLQRPTVFNAAVLEFLQALPPWA